MGTLRIIGGRWRGRKIHFADLPDVRPTPDRIRETLFNWLQTDIVEARCLDCFAGSGALGFEALSRGASKLVMIDQNPKIVKQLQETANTLQCLDKVELHQAKIPSQSLVLNEQFSIILLDPPFRTGLLGKCIAWLEQQNCFAEYALIYVEAEKELTELPVPAHWQLLKTKVAGQVSYHLFKRTTPA